jgi:HEAT repeat protein
LLTQLRNSGYLWPWQWRRLERHGDRAVVAAVVDRLAIASSYRGRHGLAQALARLSSVPGAAGLLVDEGLAARLVHEVVVEPLDQAAVYHAQVEGVRPVLELIETALRAAGPAPLPALRELLDGPPLPTLLVATAYGRLGPIGAKLTALHLLAEQGSPEDAPRLERLLEDEAEPAPVRDEAGVVWHRYVGDAAVPRLVDYAVHELVGDDRIARFATIGTPLVEPLIRYLHDADVNVRLRAKHLLMDIGAPAAAALAEVVRTADSWQTLTNAEEALWRVDKRALRDARRSREADGRSLSLAPKAAPEAERGLSRGPQPPGQG